MCNRGRSTSRLSRISGFCRIVGVAALIGWTSPTTAEIADTPFQDARKALIERFRTTGAMPGHDALRLEKTITAALLDAAPSERTALLYDLGAVRRLRSDHEGAVRAFSEAIAAAARSELTLIFDAWIGTARATAYGLDDHGAAAAALEQAITLAGPDPQRAMAHEIDAFASQIATIRGDLEEALIRSFAAGLTAQTPSDRFYAHFDRGDIFQRLAQRCDYEPLIDARTFESEPVDLWGGCSRAVDRAKERYVAALEVARGEGWSALAAMVEGFLQRLEYRRSMISAKVSGLAIVGGIDFDGDTVIVEPRFPAGASELGDFEALAAAIDEVSLEDARTDPRIEWLKGARADVAGDGARALRHFSKAADLLGVERASYFDLRRTGTVIEDQPELIVDLALRLLHYDRRDEALDVFETVRARGMSQLRHTMRSLDLSRHERALVADLLEIEARIDAGRHDLVERAIAGDDFDPATALASIRAQETELRALRTTQEVQHLLDRVRKAPPPPLPNLARLRSAVRESGVPTILYWSAPTYVVVWPVTDAEDTPLAVFLPREPLLAHVERIVRGTESPFAPFPEASARALHAYLLGPVADLLHGNEVLIVPQGPLSGLPFEALIDPESGNYFAETMAVSYAPNVDFAVRALESRPAAFKTATALIDPSIGTGEETQLPKDVDVRIVISDHLEPEGAIDVLSGAELVHILLHGRFGRLSPLLSTVALTDPKDSGKRELTAARLVEADWRETRLAVLSSCEGALSRVRLSGELYGLGWPLLVGGAEALVLSRWRVEGTSNADWIGDFYATLAQTGRPAQAAALASRAMIDRGRDHPFFWAGPQVLGR